MTIETDLLGDPISTVVERRGRPQHQVIEKKHRYVLAFVALNWAHDQIEAAIGVIAPTLRKHYLRELKCGKSMLRATAFVKLQELIDAGDLKAIKAAMHEFEKADLGPNRPHHVKRTLLRSEITESKAFTIGSETRPRPWAMPSSDEAKGDEIRGLLRIGLSQAWLSSITRVRDLSRKGFCLEVVIAISASGTVG